jgi:methyltransferase-like protein 6
MSRFNRVSESNHDLLKEALSPEERQEMEEIVAKQGGDMSKYWHNELDKHAVKNWHVFYKRNQANFFKDRHYLHREIPRIITANEEHETGNGPQPVLLEIGCGVGNTIYPLLEDFPQMRVLACDCATSAVDLVKQHAAYDPARVDAHVVDISKERLPYATGSAQFATLVYVMSALNPRDMAFALSEVRRVLAPGGNLFFRDYSEGDLTMLRFKTGARISERFYKRSDGTRTYFFQREEFMTMLRDAGFNVGDDDVLYIKKYIENVKRGITMRRIWLQAKVTANDQPSESFGVSEGAVEADTGASDAASSPDEVQADEAKAATE